MGERGERVLVLLNREQSPPAGVKQPKRQPTAPGTEIDKGRLLCSAHHTVLKKSIVILCYCTPAPQRVLSKLEIGLKVHARDIAETFEKFNAYPALFCPSA